MGNNFMDDLSKSMQAYEKYVRPVLHKFIRGEFITVEGHTDEETARLLDRLAGIDIFQKTDDGIAGIASRIQFGKNWRTFTVRRARESGARTEYEKRVYAIENQMLYPKFTYQAYIDNERLAGLAVMKTVDLLDYIKIHNPPIRNTGVDKIGQASFYVCTWDDIKSKGYTVLEYKEVASGSG